ncbi:MAG: hypothetical protein ACI9EK_002072 [Psychroserpens sp.]|jgi:hypothetical protein
MTIIKLKMDIDSKTLLIIPCSAKKLKGGKPITEYKNTFSFDEFWDKHTAELIVNCRQQIKCKHVHSYEELDNEYLPAIERYIGNVYQPELKNEQPKKTLQYIQNNYSNENQPKIMILSAFYGPLHPFELIQNYNLKMGKTTRIWKAACEQVLSYYVKEHNINKIILYAGSGSDYFKVILPTIKTLIAEKLIDSAHQYHVVDGGSSQTPATHGKLFYADMSQTPYVELSRVVEIRQGPEFSATCNKLKADSDDNELQSNFQNKQKAEIPYSSRSSFLEVIKSSIIEEQQKLIEGRSVQCLLNKSGGYNMDLSIEIISNEAKVFFTDWAGTDTSRFSSRIKAVASCLYQLDLFGLYQVAHKNGLITLKRLNHKTKNKQVNSTKPISNELLYFPANLFRDKVALAHNVKNAPGVYKWWFPEMIAQQLNIPTDGCSRDLDGNLLLYVGISKSLRKRFDWHINQKHNESSIKAGTISTLRHSICSLLGNSLQQEEPLNNLIDHLNISFEYSDSKESALVAEDLLMSEHTIPLNIQGNVHAFISTLKKKRSLCKFRSLEIINDKLDD